MIIETLRTSKTSVQEPEALQEAALTGNPWLNLLASARLRSKSNENLVLRNQEKHAEPPTRFNLLEL